MSDSSRSDDAEEDREPADLASSEGSRTFGHYLLLRELGRGAQGVVHLAEDVNLRRKVALKMLAGSGAESHDVRERFRREAELTSKFEHPGICGVYEVGAVGGVPYIAMQYVPGVTLAEILERARKTIDASGKKTGDASENIALSPRSTSKGQQLHDLIKLIERTARALHVAHESGLVHRDVKPGNVMVTTEGNPVLLDFGLARDLGAEGVALTQSGQIIGTPAYLAPEQIVATRGTVDRRTDVYALGVILFECLTLRRPFDATSWDQLFHQILHAGAPSPRELNPRIPPDLCTIIEVAMERDQTRRYPTAEAFADDLRRVRAFEPIQAKAAGRLVRARKWAQRNPGQATGAGAAAVFALAIAGLISFQAYERRRAVRDNLRRAEQLLVVGNLTEALEAAAQARERSPRSPEALELKTRIERAREEREREEQRSQDLALASAARAEALVLRQRHAEMHARMGALGDELMRSRTEVFSHAVSVERREDFARMERDLERLELENEQVMVSIEEALQRAARYESRWGDVSDATEEALADHYMVRWREALAAGDAAWTAAMRAAVVLHDRDKLHERELLGRGKLAVDVSPADAELFLFRYEGIGGVRDGQTISRLVPVPTAGVGRAREAWANDFRPGDPCLVVRAVASDSPAARAGLQVGDLLLRVQGQPSVGSVFVEDVGEQGPLAAAGLPALARLARADDKPIGVPFDWQELVVEDGGATHVLSLEAPAAELRCTAKEVRLVTPQSAAEGALHAAVVLECLRAGEPLTLSVAAHESSGLTCEPTAYPLICGPDNRFDGAQASTVDPASYLIVARAAGHETQRFHVLAERLADTHAEIELLPVGTTPEGFVYVPPGPFTAGGDPRASSPRLGSSVDLPGFFIARKELTNREWYEFLCDPRTVERLRGDRTGTNLPREQRIMARELPDGSGYTWNVYKYTTADTPVLGLSWADIQDYLAWRNERAAAEGEAWRYDLPSGDEWEKAARGVDARHFPWGDRFDPSLTVSLASREEYLIDVPGGFAPFDESPYGVLDLGGSREEWLRDPVPGNDESLYFKRGGRWNSYMEVAFRSASIGETAREYAAAGQGFRLVLRKP